MAFQILNIGKIVQEDNLELSEEQILAYQASEDLNYYIYDSYEEKATSFQFF